MERLAKLSIVVFSLLYAVAALLYPGGTRIDHATIGFSLRDNYWCDLLDKTSYRGLPNPGWLVALAAMLVLCAGLSLLWWRTPALFPEAKRRALVVRSCGIASGLVVPLIATPQHDLAVNAAGLLGTIAFVATLSTRRGPFGLGCLALAFGVADWAIWRTRIGVEALAVVQKIAFVFFLAWAYRLASALEVRRAPRAPRAPRAQRG